ncbi:hypothetical protein HanPI659440_Chr15g0580521 [Helianthus annuus]|nr:hypothetical protein HanPI659440_Chr15g0580521 [Helianthus annuus]
MLLYSLHYCFIRLCLFDLLFEWALGPASMCAEHAFKFPTSLDFKLNGSLMSIMWCTTDVVCFRLSALRACSDDFCLQFVRSIVR